MKPARGEEAGAEKVPNPGSAEAMKTGCKCAVIDNHYGRGFPYGPKQETCFWISADCRLHGARVVEEVKRGK